MASNHYDVARLANTMGMKCTIVLDPTQITKRVKNSIKKQLRQGRITGGWRSEAAKLAEHLVAKFDLNVLRDTWQGVKVGTATTDTKAMLMRIVDADWAAEMLQDGRAANVPYYQRRLKEAHINLKSHETKGFYLSFFDRAFADQARTVLAQTLTADDSIRIEQALDLLDGTEPIHITTYIN